MPGFTHHAGRWGREVLLSLGAVLGGLCVVAGLASIGFGIKPYVVMSGSMSPAIEAGDLVVTKQVAAPNLRVGDVVTVTASGGAHVTHRIESVEPYGDQIALILKGDANENSDSSPYPVSSADRVLFDIPRAGYVVAWLQSPVGLLATASLVLLALAVIFQPASHRDALVMSVVVGMALGLGAIGRSPGFTSAYFTDDGTLQSSSLAALTLSPPASTSCSSALLSATVSWPGDPRYDYEAVLRRISNNAVVSTTQVTGTGNSVTYTGLVDFGLVVGAGTVDFKVEVRSKLAVAPSWTSAGIATYSSIRVVAVLVGATVSCTT